MWWSGLVKQMTGSGSCSWDLVGGVQVVLVAALVVRGAGAASRHGRWASPGHSDAVQMLYARWRSG